MDAHRRLTVLSVAYPLAPVGPDAVGGAEQVLGSLDQALVRAGHRSIVVAWRGSDVAGELLDVPALADAPLDEATCAAQRAAVRARIAEATRTRRIDLVHLHGLDFADYLPPPGPPVLATLHLPPEWYPPEALAPSRPNTWVNCVSETQQRALLDILGAANPVGTTNPVMPGLDPGIRPRPAGRRDEGATAASWIVPPIANGVPVEALAAARHARRGYALVLGRICREKGQHLAIAAARRADVPILLAGQVFAYPEHLAYFAEQVAPLLGPGCRFVGPRGFARKRRLLAAARCVLVPSQVAETSSLVAMEALACGTPVIAFAIGALAEIVDHGRTGFLVRDVAAMAAAIGRSGAIEAATCRQAARERFSLARTTAAYLDLYRRLAAGDAAGDKPVPPAVAA